MGNFMIEEYYSRLAVLNKNPDLLKDKSDEQKTKLKTALNNISDKMESPDEDLERAITDFIKVFDELGLEEAGAGKTRGLSLKKGTNLPRQLINDVTIMTLKNF
jgi:hypothetical protein